ncbi:MAG TPA: amino acid permease [Candidatus Polarisedimenticolia bacterium]
MKGEAEASRIEPRLSVLDTAMVVVSLVIGIGIFRTPALVARDTGSYGRFLAAWAIGGLASLVGALVFAEIGSRYPRAGGYYKVVAHCWHPMVAFLLNWAQVLMQGAGAAGVALIGSEYLLRLVGRDEPAGAAPVAVAALLVSGLTALNAAGIRAGARAQNLLSLSKIVLIAGLAFAGLALAPGLHERGDAGEAPGAPPAGMLGALVAVFYAYGGYQNSMNLAGDLREARRNLPLSISAGMAIVTALYLAINTAYIRALGPAGVAASPLVAADLARVALGAAGEMFVSLAIFLSAAGFVNATILHVPRSYLAMAEDGLLPPSLGRLSPRTGAQLGGLAFFAATALAPLLLLGAFDKLLAYVMFTDALSLAALASCLFILRRRGEGNEAEGTWRMPFYPWLPAAFVLVLFGLAGDLAVRQTRLALAGAGIVVAGIPLYFLMTRSWGRKNND